MRNKLSLFLICVFAIVASSFFSHRATAQELSGKRVASSIKSAINFLRGEQDRRTGRWSTIQRHKGGVTSLTTLSLLLGGVAKNDPMIRNSLKFLDGLDVENDGLSVYTVSLLIMIYCEVDADLYRARIRECVQYLVDSQFVNKAGRGGWAYERDRRTSRQPDGSNTQFAILALSDASKHGIEVDDSVWQNARWYWEASYKGRGRFIYREDNFHRDVATGSMVCAAIASLIIIDEHLPKPVPVKDSKIVCCGLDDQLEMVDAADVWMQRHFTTRRNPADGDSMFSVNRFYYLYSMERAARLSGQRFFGEHDWYREGAKELIRIQQQNGRWEASSKVHGEDNKHVATALALLFLSKGRRPVVIGKYKHSDDNDWNRHRNGVHYLTRQLELNWKTKLSWQTIDGRHATARDLWETTPVLFISGRDALRLNDDQVAALKEYVEEGGFIFAEACQGDGCGKNVGFDKDFRELVKKLFPNSKMQLLDPSHPVYSAQYQLPFNPERPLEGVQSSCRTSLIYCPANMAGLWRCNRPSFMSVMPESASKQVKFATQLGENIIAYATGRDVKDKLDRPQLADSNEGGTGQRIVLIPKLTHGGGADDAPNAWQNIMQRASVDLKQRFKIGHELIAPDPEQLGKYPTVFMHGRSSFQWNEEQRAAIREHLVDKKGFLFADSICSSSGFVTAFRNEMKQIFPDATLERIPETDPIWNEEGGGYDLRVVHMHEPDKNAAGGVRQLKSAPQLEGIRWEGRWVVVFSPHDLSCAMENGAAAQCAGYDKDDAARIGVNVILYALKP